MSAAKMVKRLSWEHGEPRRMYQYVTDADAARLEAVVEAADEMRSVLVCDTGKRAGAGCVYHCTNCSIAEDYDDARAAMGEAGKSGRSEQTNQGDSK